MSLHLSTCVTVREPGFSRSETIDLARRIERGGSALWPELECDPKPFMCPGVLTYNRNFSPREVHTMIAALLAYAE